MNTARTVLRGLQPQPLGSYLAALGLFRVVSEQLDDSVRAWWSPQGFTLSGVSLDAIVTFLVHRYQPTPLVAPWAGGSGFSEGEDATAIDMIRESSNPRVARYRSVVEQVLKFPELPPRGLRVRDVIEWAETAIRDDGTSKKLRDDLEQLVAKVDRAAADTAIEVCNQKHPAAKIFTQMKSQRRAANKSALAARCRNELPDECLRWIDASLVLHVDDAGEIDQIVGPMSKDAVKPKLEFSRLFMQAICDVVLGADRERSGRVASSLLSGGACAELTASAAGLFELGSAGGFNTGPGFETKDLPNNPWKLAMVFEGCVLWSGSVSRRAGTSRIDMAIVGPFTTRHVAGGLGASGHASSEKALTEVWTPLWNRPASIRELSGLLSEGRASIGGRDAENAIEFAEAVASLGVDRGVTAFTRFALIERRGPSYIAVPSGTLDVRARREVELVRQLDGELAVLDGFLRRFRGEGPPAQLLSRRRAIDDARFDALQRGGSETIRALVRTIGALEAVLARRDPGKDPRLWRPLGGLGAEWIDACGDTAEVRIAAAIASIGRTGAAEPLRAYLAPVNPEEPRRYSAGARSLAWQGVDLADRLANVLRKRFLDARSSASGEDSKSARNPTWGARRAAVSDVASFIAGDIDERALEDMIFGFTWLKETSETAAVARSLDAPPAPRSYVLLRLLFSSEGIPYAGERIHVAPDPSIIALLRVGRVSDALEITRRQLVAWGLHSRRVIDPGIRDLALGRRLAGALLIPVPMTARLVGDCLLPERDPDRFDRDANIAEESFDGY